MNKRYEGQTVEIKLTGVIEKIYDENHMLVNAHSVSIPIGAISIISNEPTIVSTESVKAWLRSLPMEQRQLILDELTACTLRTLK